MRKRKRDEEVVAPETARTGPWWLPVALIVGALLVVYGDVIVGGRAFFLEDLTLYHHPMKQIVRDAFWSGEIPFWNPRVGAGQPLAANPAYEVFYPGQWPLLVGDYDVMFQAHIVIHAFIAALGMYLLCMSLGMGTLAASLGAVTFGAGGPMLSATKLLPFMFAMAWVPFIVLFVRRFLLVGGRRNMAAASMFAGLQLLVGEPVMVLQTWLIIMMYAARRLSQGPKIARRPFPTLARLGTVIALSAALAAVQIAPAIDHARDSVRSRGLKWEVASSWSSPIQRPLEILFPGVYRQIYDEKGASLMKGLYGHDVPYIADLYVGLLPALLALSYLVTERTGRRWIVGGLLALWALSAGSHLPFFRLAYDIGIFRSIRYPEKFLLGAFFVLCILAAAGAQRLADGDRRVRRACLALAGIWVAIAVVGALVGSGFEPVVAEARQRVGAVILSARSYWLLAIPRGLLAVAILLGCVGGGRRHASAAAILLSAVELGIAAREVAPTVERSYFARPALLDLPSASGGRLYHQAETSWWHDADPRAVAVLEDERHVWRAFRAGAFPLIPAGSGVPIVLGDDLDETYLLPTAEFGAMWSDLRRKAPFVAPLLWRMAGVEWVASFDRIVSVDRVARGEAPVVIQRVGDGERYWFASSVQSIASAQELGARIASRSFTATSAATADLSFVPAPGKVVDAREWWNRIELSVEADGPAFLVVSVTPHKYWAATVDGESADLVPTNVGFQGLVVPKGVHTVEMRYRNPLIVSFGVLSGLTLLGLVAMLVVPRKGSESSFDAGNDSTP